MNSFIYCEEYSYREHICHKKKTVPFELIINETLLLKSWEIVSIFIGLHWGEFQSLEKVTPFIRIQVDNLPESAASIIRCCCFKKLLAVSRSCCKRAAYLLFACWINNYQFLPDLFKSRKGLLGGSRLLWWLFISLLSRGEHIIIFQ